MEILLPNQIAAFLKRFRFRGGTVRSVSLRTGAAQQSSAAVVVSVLDTDSKQRVRLRLRFDGVEEYRFQRRPGAGMQRLKVVSIGWFNGLMYLNLDAYATDGPAALHDFRASDAFIAGRSLSWEMMPPKTRN
jgi:hypothetical protein